VLESAVSLPLLLSGFYNRAVPSTTARLVVSLDAILFEIDRMNAALDEAHGIAPEDRSTLKREIVLLRERADTLMEWLSDQRLEAAKN
jgi:hypothetical protein